MAHPGPRADLHFYFDPVCPFAWMTSKWVRLVAEQRDYTVDWRFISLRLLNAHLDYDSHFPAGYDGGHTAGLRLLRVAARVRSEYGRDSIGPLYEAIGTQVFDDESAATDTTHGAYRGEAAFLRPILERVGLPTQLTDTLDDERWDAEIQRETDEALDLTGRDVGTPIIHVEPPEGVAFFGPVISRLPAADDAVLLWDHVARAGAVPRLRRAQAQPSRTTPAGELRGSHREVRHPGGLARRKPTRRWSVVNVSGSYRFRATTDPGAESRGVWWALR